MAKTKLLPYIVEIQRNSEKHTKVMEFIMARVNQSRARRNKRSDKWNESEDLFTAYVKETDADSRRRTKKRDQGYPEFTTVTIPYSYATLMTAHTYWTSVFLARNPILQVQGTNGEAQTSEQAVDAMLQHFIMRGRNLVPYFIWLMDQGKYGEAIMGETWDVQKTMVPEAREVPRSFAGVPIPGTKKREWHSREVIGYEGIRNFNVRPHDFLFDPTVTLQNFQDGEYAGHEAFVSFNRLKDGEALGRFYNLEFVRGRKSSNRATNAAGQNLAQTSSSSDLPRQELPGTGYHDGAEGVDLIEITIELVPKDLSLAPREFLEKWVFTIANDDTIISAQPSGWYHNEYNYSVLEYEIEGYNTSKRGMMEMLRPLNQTLDWLFNTHFFNVRKILNDEFIYDPSILVSKDVEAPGPGKLIRVRPEAYGKDVTKAFYQLQVADVTQNHIRDAQLVIEMMQRLTGVNDTVMGMVKTGRKTATEIRSSSSFAVNRLKTQCEFYSAMGFAPHTSRLVKMAQQMLAGRPERYFRITGNSAAALAGMKPFVLVGPDEIAGEFDYIPVDGTLPIDRQAQAAVFAQIMQQGYQIPAVAQQYDWAKLFGYGAELSGIKNLEQFRIQVNVVPDGQAMADMQAGNLVPMGQAGGGAAQMLNQTGIDPQASQ